MMRALRQVSLKTQFSKRAASWTPLVNQFTPKETVDALKGLDKKIADRRAVAGQIKKDVAPIDWDYWTKTIRTPGVVAQLKKQYESHVFEDQKPDLDAIHGKANSLIAAAEKEAEHAKTEIGAIEEEIKRVQKERNEMVDWGVGQFYERFPGVEAELRDEANQSEWLSTPEEQKVGLVDLSEIRRALNEGNQPNFPDFKEVGDFVGDFNLTEELAQFEARYKAQNPQ